MSGEEKIDKTIASRGHLLGIHPTDLFGLALDKRTRPELAVAYAQQKTPIQKVIGKCWEDVLLIQPIGLYDNYFHLDGDSLQMTQIISRIREQLGVELSFSDFFEAPTIASLAVAIESRMPT